MQHTPHGIRRRRAHWTAALVTLVALGAACFRGATTGPVTHGSGHAVLFIGNSLTYENNLPAMVERLGAEAGDSIDAWTAAEPNFALIDHYTGGRTVSAIQGYPWEYVILQQGPSTLDVSRDTLILATQLLDPYIRQAGAQTALFMVWPDVSRAAFFDQCRDNYRAAAQAVGGVFMPAGEAWRAVWATDPAIGLYGSDGYHPSPVGSFVAALEIFERITGIDARTLTVASLKASGLPGNTPDDVARRIQEAVHATNLKYPARD